MSNIKVSEMTELQENDIADDDILYIVDTSERTNRSKKVSIASLRSKIGISNLGNTSGNIYNGNIPDWGSTITVGSILSQQSVTIPCDCFVWYYRTNINGGDSTSVPCIVDSVSVPARFSDVGFYCGSGSVIKINPTTTSYSYTLRIVPLVYANTMESGIVTIENQTPQQIT